jgi:DNA-binding SARP family transcriptional activator
MIPIADRWRPFAERIDPAEQRARLRSLRALAKVYAGSRAADVCRLLAQAETDSAALEPASVALNRLAPTDRRNVLVSYARLSSSV